MKGKSIMYIEKGDTEDEFVLSIKELERGTKYLIENKNYQMEVRLRTPEAKTVILLSHRKKTAEGNWRSTMEMRDEHFGWAVWILRTRGFIPAPPEGTVFEIYDEKNQQPLADFPVYATETEAYAAYVDKLFDRGMKGESSLAEKDGKSVEMQLYQMEPWEKFQLFGYVVRPVQAADVEPERLKSLKKYSVN